MIYSDFQNEKLSALGLGCMRLPVIGGNDSVIDETAAAEMVRYAMDNGINYYDTAWGYHNGESENVMGKILEKYPRDSFYLASKFPGYDLSNMGRTEEIFEAQLKKCRVEYFDFYLFHNVCEMNIDYYLDPKYGAYDYLIKQKKNGRIKHLGFSAHGSTEVIRRFLEAYGKDMEFGQLQLNWFDADFQNTSEKVRLLAEYNIPVWVMEPLRGGRLAKLPEKYMEKLTALRPGSTAAQWAFRYLQSIADVKLTLSGMSDMAQLSDNISTYEEAKPLNENELKVLSDIAAEMSRDGTVPCTACHYCVSHCPQGLDIPRLLELYNEHNFTGGGFIAPMGLMAIDKDKQPSECVGCRSCEEVCPQQIKISEVIAKFSSML